MAECGQVSKLDIPSYIRSSKAGDILQLRYHPKEEDFRLVMSPAENGNTDTLVW